MRRTYVFRDGEWVERSSFAPAEYVSASIMPDIQPYRSMVDGSRIGGRRQHRDHLRAHGVIEVGNEKMETKLAPPKDTRRERLREQLGNMTHKQADRIMANLREQARRH